MEIRRNKTSEISDNTFDYYGLEAGKRLLVRQK
jgi:hypothetical protein